MKASTIKILSFIGLGLALLGLASCGGSDDDGVDATQSDKLLAGRWQAQSMTGEVRLVLTFTMKKGERGITVEGKANDGSTAFAVAGTYTPKGKQIDFIFPPTDPMTHNYEIDDKLLVIDKTYYYSKTGEAGDVIGGRVAGRVKIGPDSVAIASKGITVASAVPGEVLVRYKENRVAVGNGSLQGMSLASGAGDSPEGGSSLTVQSVEENTGTGITKIKFKERFTQGWFTQGSSSLQAMGVETADFAKQVFDRRDLYTRAHSQAKAACAQLKASDPDIEACSPNTILRIQSHAGDKWNLPLINQPAALTFFPNNSGSDLIVAVLDSGIIPNHPAFQGRLVAGYDFVDNNADATDTMTTGAIRFHGTHVAGIVASVAPKAKIMPIRIVNGTETNVDLACQGLDWAKNNGARIINMSFGYPLDAEGRALFEPCLRRASQAGLVLVAASGNGNPENPSVPMSNETVYPCAFQEVICVGMTGEYGEFVDSYEAYGIVSNYGPRQDLVAPGVEVTSAIGPTDQYGLLSGTSQAAPHVAGVAAMMLSKNPALNKTQVKDILTQTAFDLGSVGRDNYYGWGLVNAGAALSAVANQRAPLSVSYATMHLEEGLMGAPLLVFNREAAVTIKDQANVPWLSFETLEKRNAGWIVGIKIDETLAEGTYNATVVVTYGASTLEVPVIAEVTSGSGDPDDLEKLVEDLIKGAKDYGAIDLFLVNTATGKPEAHVRATSSGGYTFLFEGIADGNFYLAAGIDTNKDGKVCGDIVDEPCTGLSKNGTVPKDLKDYKILTIDEETLITNLTLNLPTPSLTDVSLTK
ncbi:MAG: S8 family serine peptidase [Deltaproteobacteria bacterium]|nr:S8 family serine peptidase [Deltaproteobacteria bacterium]